MIRYSQIGDSRTEPSTVRLRVLPIPCACTYYIKMSARWSRLAGFLIFTDGLTATAHDLKNGCSSVRQTLKPRTAGYKQPFFGSPAMPQSGICSRTKPCLARSTVIRHRLSRLTPCPALLGLLLPLFFYRHQHAAGGKYHICHSGLLHQDNQNQQLLSEFYH